MGRNDNHHHHHHHHKSGYSRHDGNKHHRQSQQQGSSSSYQSLRPEPFESQCMPVPFQIPTFIQPPPLMAQFNPIVQHQAPLLNAQQQQQIYFNQVQQYAVPPVPDMNPALMMQNSAFLPQQLCNPQWLSQSPQNVSFNISQSSNARSDEQAISAEALSRLQLPANQITETGIIPNTPYYELPAGLMVPLIPNNQIEYKSLNPADLRLPLPKFPDENFLKSIDSYYGTDGKLRDNDGWDREFIEMFIGQKNVLAGS